MSKNLTAAVLLLLCGLAPAAQPARSATEFVAFRVDDRRVIAVVGEIGDGTPDAVPGQGELVARYGFRPRDADAASLVTIPDAVKSATRWVVHLPGGRRVTAAPERMVQGSPSCTGLAGVLLAIDESDRAVFAAVRDKYYVASLHPTAVQTGSRSPTPAPVPLDTAQLEALVQDLLRRELPGVRQEMADEIARLEASDSADHRAWARERRALDEALAAGKARLRYDVQPFQLERNGPPRYFVRAEWLVGGKQAFGAAVWITGGDTPAIADADLTPARWLRMWEFQGAIDREQFGMVLSVIDRDGDGWSEILLARGGYEAMHLQLVALTPKGFTPTGIGYSYGC